MSVFNTSIGFGAYANTGLGAGIMSMITGCPEECDSTRAKTCSAPSIIDGSSICYDECGCEIYKESGSGKDTKIEVLSKKVSSTGKQFLQDRVQYSRDTGEALNIDMFGKKVAIPGAMSMEKKLAIGGVVLGAVLLIIFALKSQ